MRSLVRWNPYREFAALDRILNDDLDGGRVWRPALDVVENDDAYIVRASLPGLKAEEIDVNVVDDVLTIKAEHSDEHEESDENYLMRERTYGSYHRSLRLPAGVDGENTTAQFEDGVLTLTLAKQEELKPKKIEVAVK